MKRLVQAYIALAFVLVLTSCRDKGQASASSAGIEFKYAERIADGQLALLGREYSRVVVDASVYSGLMKMLGVEGKCIDMSDNMRLDMEKVAASNPDLIMLSAYDGADIEKYKRLGVPVVECRDFLEPTAMGRAEWVRFFGRLWGVEAKADSLFAVVEREYFSFHSNQPVIPAERPVVFYDLIYGNLWYQPVKRSVSGQLVSDAGGKLPFDDDSKGGSRALSAEKVLLEAKDADFWLIRYGGRQPLTRAAMAGLNPLYAQFRAFKEKRVFVCYTDKTHYFEETAFRPDWLLKDYYNILHAAPDSVLHYFERVE